MEHRNFGDCDWLVTWFNLDRDTLKLQSDSVVVHDLRYDVLNYNYLGLNPQLLPITITQILGQ